MRQWVFCASARSTSDDAESVDLFKAVSVPIRRHVKIRAAATPYDPCFVEYLAERSRLAKFRVRVWDRRTVV